jgi:hypothetical protein
MSVQGCIHTNTCVDGTARLLAELVVLLRRRLPVFSTWSEGGLK